MSQSDKIPVPLFQVLEEEYIALHGLPDEDGSLPVQLADARHRGEFRTVTANLDWQFHPSHIRHPRRLAALLGNDPNSPTTGNRTLTELNAYDRARKNLIVYLREHSDAATLQALQTISQKTEAASTSDTKLISDQLNAFLQDPNLYDEERFSSYWLSDASKQLVDAQAGEKFTGENLARFNRLLLEDAFTRTLEKIQEIRLAAVYQRIHRVKQTSLCLSGGGIRSGTFGLGLLQGLARHNLLDKFHYLSTVSGGGYIGGWLAAWIHRHPMGLAGVTADLANSNPLKKVDPDPAPIGYLRRYSNFITPKVGLLTADTWTFIAIYLRNLFLNWIVFIPFLLSVLMLPRLIVLVTLAQPRREDQWSIPIPLFGGTFAFFGRHFFLLGGFILATWALAYIIFSRPTLRERLRQSSRFWADRATQRSFLVWCLLPLVSAAFCLTTYWAWSSERSEPKDWYYFIIFGLTVCALAWLIASIILGRLKPTFIATNWRRTGTIEFFALLFAGPLGGVVLWLFTLSIEPIRTRANFPWDYWSTGADWTWLTWNTELYACLAVPLFMLVFLLGATLFIGASSASSRIDDEDREWWARLGAWALIAILGWSVFCTLVIFGPIALLSAPRVLFSVGGLSGILAAIVGRSAKTPATSKSQGEAQPGIVSILLGKALPLLAVIFIGALLISLSLLTTGLFQQIAILANDNPQRPINQWLTNISAHGFNHYMRYIYFNLAGKDPIIAAKLAHMNVLHHTSFFFALIIGLALFVFGLIVSRIMNLNIFSLHAGYRSRLIRAFLGASRPDHQRKPNPFTGFDPADNVSMHELRLGLFDEDDFRDPVTLVSDLLDQRKPVSKYLGSRQLLANIESLPTTTTVSSRMVAALRKDLNAALQDEGLSSQSFVKDLPDPEVQTNALAVGQQQSSWPAEELRYTATHILANRRVLEAAYPNLIRPRQGSDDYKLMPLINTTLNLVGGDNLAWQQRKAEPFSVTPLHSGCFRLGYRDSRVYGGSDTGGISIGTAASISGAAASSNMGYYTTSSVLSLVLTFFNVRLGWWLGNPGAAGNDTFTLRAPKGSVLPVLEEALGMTDDQNEYVYLTDGGHFENLGIFEMVLRRCHIIVVSDAAADPDYRFSDLGNAIRKVRIDLGVPIEFTALPIFSGSPDGGSKGSYWAIGKIRYSCIDGPNADDGLLLYIKPAIYGVEPQDVLEYKRSHPSFPHQSTADQFFDEPQFESYRILSSYIMDQMAGEQTGPIDL
ncbi:MAG TPA: patatin-like phospholipase family protein, partial [Pyrinomonadaceae bacterium]|nr:patatin-like phospholipase family protein [Pyrinomonadaceae bacterium]